MGFPENEDQYRIPLLAKLLHSLPHYNITFHRTNNTFRPKNEVYLESLGIFGSIPAALLIVSLFGLLLYLMSRCCDRKQRAAHSITSLKVILCCSTTLCCAAIGLGLYGNDDLHNGLLEVLTAGRNVDSLVSSVRNLTNTLEFTLTQKIRPQLTDLADVFDRPTQNQTALSQLILALNVVQGNVTSATNAASDIRRPLMGIHMTNFLTRCDHLELVRWPGTVAILALLLVLCAVLLVGVARHSRCALILFSVCGLLAVTGSWLMSGLYLSSSVAVGDLCTDPADYLVSESPRELPAEVLLYYTKCESLRSNPFTQRLRESQNSINNARNAMLIVSRVSLVLFRDADLGPRVNSVTSDLNASERLLTGLTAQVDCKQIHYNYLNATRGLCEGGLLGLVLMLIASFIAALLLTVMVWVDSHTWIYIRKRNDYSNVDETYVSHQTQQQMAQQQQMQNHQNMTKTLPRQHNNNGPPAISGSHTLQHPSRNHKQQQQQQQDLMHKSYHHQHATMRPMGAGMGTHTLGRLPSHNNHNSHHSPTHLIGPNNACSEHPHHMAQQQQQQQAPHLAGMHPQQQQYHQSYHHQHHNSDVTAMPQHHQYSYAHVQHQQYPLNTATMPRRQSTPPSAMKQQNLLKANQQSLQQQPHQLPPHPHQLQQQQQLPQQYPLTKIQTHDPASNKLPPPEATIPNSNAINSEMYERDKQIYKCSTMRQGGKYDAKGQPIYSAKPSILNCPLPEIPKEAGESGAPPTTQSKVDYCHTLRFSQTMKRIPTGKAIPLPKIGSTFDNTKPLNNSTPAMHNNTQQLPPPPASVLQNHLQHPPPPMTMMTNAQTDLTLQQQQPTAHNHTSNTNNIQTNNNPNNTNMTTTNTSNSMSPPPPPLNDSEFYAVTEL